MTNSTTINLNATANSNLTTTAISTPAGAALNPATLASLNIVTSAGPQTDAAAIAATTLFANTRAFTTTSGALTSTGALSLLATSNHHLDTTANATPTVSAGTNNGFAVGTNLTLITDESFIGGSPTITAPTINIHTGGGNNLDVLSRSGAAGLNTVNQALSAGSVALNTNLPRLPLLGQQGNLSQAYIAAGANLTLPSGNTDINIGANYTAHTDLNAEPDGVIAGTLGVGRSVATNISMTTAQGSNRRWCAHHRRPEPERNSRRRSDHASHRLCRCAGRHECQFADPGRLILEQQQRGFDRPGATMNLAGTLTARANHTGLNIIRARADAAAALDVTAQGLATPIAVNLSNDTATATVAGSVIAIGNVNILSDSQVQNQAEAIAGTQGADNNGTNADAMIAGEVAFLQNRANLAFGNAPAPPVTRPSTSLQNQQTTGNAAALAFNLANAGATANLASTGSVTAGGGTLNVIATSDIDSNAFATATTVEQPWRTCGGDCL